ncbi:MAG: cytochrome C oxidase subunit IV family protein [Acidimicrobiia bacterium]|nr:cytochrome C oxidase subunit IV family protein [Acidimicrobiia bacterium]
MTQTPSVPTEAAEDVQPADAETEDVAAEHDAEHEHPSDRQYVKVALILGALTALEVATYFESVHHLGDAALYALLVVLMVLKFIYVVAWFMHLKFDSVILRRIFVAGIVLALGVYLVMLTAFRIWGA